MSNVDTLITPELLRHLSPGLDQKTAELAALKLEWAAKTFGVNTKLRVAHFLAQLGHESGFKPVEEDLYYTASRLHAVFPSVFNDANSARPYAGKPKLTANKVYAKKNGNGGEETGDGYLYRGRGMIQLTGRANYREYGRLIGYDLENHPELATQFGISALVACAYWVKNGLNKLADQDDLEGITRRVNGRRMMGLEDRRRLLVKAKKFLGL